MIARVEKNQIPASLLVETLMWLYFIECVICRWVIVVWWIGKMYMEEENENMEKIYMYDSSFIFIY